MRYPRSKNFMNELEQNNNMKNIKKSDDESENMEDIFDRRAKTISYKKEILQELQFQRGKIISQVPNDSSIASSPHSSSLISSPPIQRGFESSPNPMTSSPSIDLSDTLVESVELNSHSPNVTSETPIFESNALLPTPNSIPAFQRSQSGHRTLGQSSTPSPFTHASSPLPHNEDGVYLGGGRAMSLSPAFGSESYDSLQRDQVLRSMSTNSSKNLSSISSLSIPRISSVEKGNLADNSLRPLVAGSGISDFLSDSTVSLLSNVPAAMQSQQQYLALALNSSGAPSASFINSGPGLETGGPYLSGSKVPPTLTSVQPNSLTSSSKSNSKSIGRPSTKSDGSKTKGKGSDHKSKTSSNTSYHSVPSTIASPPSSSVLPETNAEDCLSTPTTPHSDHSSSKSNIKYDTHNDSPLTTNFPELSNKPKKRDHAKTATSRASVSSQSKPIPPVSTEGIDEDTLLQLQHHETLKLKLNLLDRKETLAHRAPAFHAPRLKTQWDYLLEEIQWMAVDFHQERRWKISQSSAIADSCSQIFQKLNDISYTKWISDLGYVTRESIYSRNPRKRRLNSPSEPIVDRNLLAESQSVAKKLSTSFYQRILHQFGSGDQSSASHSIQSNDSMSHSDNKLKKECTHSDDDLRVFDNELMSILSNFEDSLPPITDLTMEGHLLKKTQKDVLYSAISRINRTIGCFVYGSQGLGKTTCCAALVSSWITKCQPSSSKSTILIISPATMFLRWRSEINKFLKCCTFSILEDLISSKDNTKSLSQKIGDSDILYCSNLEVFRTYLPQFCHSVNWRGIVLDIRKFVAIDLSSWDIDIALKLQSPTNDPPSTSGEEERYRRKLQEVFSNWIIAGRDLFAKSSVFRCCVSSINFLPPRQFQNLADPYISSLNSWLQFSLPSLFSENFPEVSIGERWLRWYLIVRNERSLLSEKLPSMCCLKLNHWSPNQRIEVSIHPVDMIDSHSRKYVSVVKHLDSAMIFGSSACVTDIDFHNFVVALLILQKLCFHEEFVQITTDEKLKLVPSQNSSLKIDTRNDLSILTNRRYLSYVDFTRPRSSPKLDRLLEILQTNKNSKIVVVVNRSEEALYTHSYLKQLAFPHIFAGISRSYYQGQRKFEHWFAAQHAIMQFNDNPPVPNAQSNVLVLSGWLLQEEWLTELNRSRSSFYSISPSSADLVVTLSTDWTCTHKFANWFMSSNTSPRIIHLVFNHTIEHRVAQKSIEFVDECADGAKDPDLRREFALGLLQGMQTSLLFSLANQSSTFLGNAPPLGFQSVTAADDVNSPNPPLRTKESFSWIQSFRILLRNLDSQFSTSKFNSSTDSIARSIYPFTDRRSASSSHLDRVFLSESNTKRLWFIIDYLFSILRSTFVISYLLRLMLMHHEMCIPSQSFASFLPRNTRERLMRNGYGVCQSEHLLNQIYEPYLRPKICQESKTKDFKMNGVDSIGAFNISKSNSFREGHSTEAFVYTNPLQSSTGRDVVECPTWLSSRHSNSIKFSISFGSAQMTADPSDPNSELKSKHRVKTGRKAATIAVDTIAAVSNPVRPPTTPDEMALSSPVPTPLIPTLPNSKVAQRNKTIAPPRYNPFGTGWHKVNPIIQKQEEAFPAIPATAAAFLSTTPLGRDGKKYKNVGEKRIGGFSPSTFSNMNIPPKPNFEFGTPNSVHQSKDFPQSAPPIEIKLDRKVYNTSGSTLWSESEALSLDKLVVLLNVEQNQRYSGSGWLHEKYLDQASSLINSSHRSARQAVTYPDCIDLPHRKRHHEEISSSEEKSSTIAKSSQSDYPSKRCGIVVTAAANHTKMFPPSLRKVSEDSRLLPVHHSHEMSSTNPSLKPYQILTLTREQPNVDLHYYARGNGKHSETHSSRINVEYGSETGTKHSGDGSDRINYSHNNTGSDLSLHGSGSSKSMSRFPQPQQKQFRPPNPPHPHPKDFISRNSDSNRPHTPYSMNHTKNSSINSRGPPESSHPYSSPQSSSESTNFQHYHQNQHQQSNYKNISLKSDPIDLSQQPSSDYRKVELLSTLLEKKSSDQNGGV